MPDGKPNYTQLVRDDPNFVTEKTRLQISWDRLSRTGRIVWLTLGAMGTMGGAWGFIQILTRSEPSPAAGLSDQNQTDLLGLVREGKLSPEQAERLALAMTGQAFPDSDIASLAELPEASEQQRYADGVRELAQSNNALRRAALANIGDPETRASGLSELAALAESSEQWRQLGELAYPWDTKLALSAYEKIASTGNATPSDIVYLGRLYIRSGQSLKAEILLKQVIQTDFSPHEKMVLFVATGDVAMARNDLPAARLFYEDGLTIAKILADGDPENADYQSNVAVSYDRLGDVARAQNDLSTAKRFHQLGLTIAKILTDGDPGNAEHQHGLSNSYHKLGDIARAQNDLSAAKRFYQDGLTIAKTLVDGDPGNSEYQHDLSISYGRLGNVSRALNDLPAAKRFYQDGLTVRKTLADGDPGNAEYQRALSVSYNKLGDVARAQNDLSAAKRFHQLGLTIAKTLADGDPRNAGYQRDLILSLSKLAATEPENALSWWMQAKAVSDLMIEKGQFAPKDAHIPSTIDAAIARLSAP